MSEKYCSNCCKNISASTFFLHERMCSINVKKCPKCNKPFTVDDLEDHIKEVHTLVDCEYCKKKFPKTEIDNHQKKCDSKMVPCAYCEMNVLLGELKEHQKACGAITEPCVKCNRYIQRKNMDKHLMDGCPPPKNERRSVDVIRNDNRPSLAKNNKNNINNYIPININDFVPDELFFEDDNKNLDIKMHNNIKKPNLQIRPASGKKLLNETAKKNASNIGNNNSNSINNIFNNKETNNKPSNTNNINNKENTKKNPQIKKPVKKEMEKAKAILYNKDNKDKTKDKEKKADYFNKQNYLNKPAVLIKPGAKDNSNKTNNSNMNNSRYNGRDNTKKISSKPNFNITKGSMKVSKEKVNDEEFRKTRDKLTFKEAKNISGKNMNNSMNNNKNKNNNNKNNNNKNNNLNKINNNINNNLKNKNNEKHNKIINDEDYIANFNFGDVIDDDEQLMQDIIAQSLKEK